MLSTAVFMLDVFGDAITIEFVVTPVTDLVHVLFDQLFGAITTVADVKPGSPCEPVGPCGPSAPVGPCGPVAPVDP
jgi:hypothetical protein